MKKINPPTQRVREALTLCVSRIEDPAFKARAESVVDELEASEAIYSQRGGECNLYSVAGTATVGALSKDEMVSLYDQRFSKKGHPAREIYDSLRASAKFNLCPLCGHRQVATLDHYLPKASHPAFAITPLNLVPSCSDCNKIKLADVAVDAQSQTFHPYFDACDDGVWLRARILEDIPPAITFFVDAPRDWAPLKIQRVSGHFTKLGLPELYGSNAAQELAQISGALVELSRKSGEAEVRAHLEQQAQSRSAVACNSWQAAMYAALAGSEWFQRIGIAAIRA